MNSKSYIVMAFMMTMVIGLPAQYVAPYDIEVIGCGQPLAEFIKNICHGRTDIWSHGQIYDHLRKKLTRQCCVNKCSSFEIRNFYCPREIVEEETIFTVTKPVTYPSRRFTRSGGPIVQAG